MKCCSMIELNDLYCKLKDVKVCIYTIIYRVFVTAPLQGHMAQVSLQTESVMFRQLAQLKSQS